MAEEKKINSIVRAVNILRIISEGSNHLSDISKRVQLSKATVHRILKTLEETDLVKQDPINRHYFLGPLIIGLSSSTEIAHNFLVYCSNQELLRLRDITHETVNLQIRMGLERICIREIESLESIKYISGMGAVHPLYLGSAGKILLSEMRDQEIQTLLEYVDFHPVCINTITNKDALIDEIEKIRNQGYAESFSERIRGSASISVPIRNYSCPVALSVLGPENRFDSGSMKKCLTEMLRSSETISNLLTRNRATKEVMSGRLQGSGSG